jgi:(E)-4-hydroxy-3-methylbut-2-enyl-diphosphate synthase
MTTREGTRKIKVGGVVIGGGAPVSVQSMTNTDTRDVAATVRQIRRLEDAGCQIVRVGVPDMAAARQLGAIKRRIALPLVADIHFDHRLALEAIAQGVDKLRINPGNMGAREHVAAVVRAARQAKIPIRIGVNAGSLKAVHGQRGPADGPEQRARLLVDAALGHIRILESFDFHDIAVSLKASDVATTVAAYRLLARRRNYPLHLGITEAGSMFRGTIKSSVGLGIMLAQGLGDTIRVSLTADPVEEVTVAYQILQSLGLRSTGIDIVSCPTCGRCEVNLIDIVNRLESELAAIRPLTSKAFGRRPLKIAVMGCVVNGPGEAKDADLGIAGGKGKGMIFENGTVVGTVAPQRWVGTLVSRIRKRITAKK